jgi:sugar phosphate isomerase/epimerase
VTTPGIPNDYALSTSCFGTRLANIQDQIFATVGMGFRRLELGLTENPPSMEGLEESRRETGISIPSMVVGCRDPLNGSMAVERLGSLMGEECERAMNSVRRHVRLAQRWGCDAVVVRGSRVEDPALKKEADYFSQRVARNGLSCETREEIRAFVRKLQRRSQKQVEQFCRSLYTLSQESPGTTFAIEPASELDEILGRDAMGWVLDDLANVKYWHDIGRIHQREVSGLEPQGEWLEAFGARMYGIHLQDASDEEAQLPLGTGEVDFQLIAEYIPKEAQRVLEIGPRHGRAEILASVQFLLDRRF